MDKRVRFPFIIFLLIISFYVSGQTEVRFFDSTRHVFPDYIENYSDSLSVQLAASSKYNKFEISSNPADSKVSKVMRFNPNKKASLGFGVNYKWFGLSLGVAFPFLNNDDFKYGHTDQFDLQANFYLRKFIIDGYLQTYKGYYINNPLDFDTAWFNNRTNFPSRSDIQTASAGLAFSYVKNHKKFSYKAPFSQTERQKKRAGSWIFGGFFSIYYLGADSNIVKFAAAGSFNDSCKIRYAIIISEGVSAGYAYTFIIKKRYYISLSFMPGLAYQTSHLWIEGMQTGIKKSGVNLKTQARFAMGYSGEKYYWGFSAVSDEFVMKNSTSSQLKYSLGNIKFFFGRWFNLKKSKSKPN
ncbi:MAG: DUF4421 family protein [Bacteroidia bacterium]|nr:DUF4421 family protein [Bacteroidia bacterium]